MNAEAGRKGLKATGWAAGLYVLAYLTLKWGFRWWWVFDFVAALPALIAIARLEEWYKSLP